MPRRGWLYGLRYRAGELALRAFVALFPRLPERLTLALVELGARLAFSIARRYRNRMEQAVAEVLAEELPDPRARREFIYRAWRNFARTVYETGRALYARPEEIRSMVQIEGEEHLKRALARGRGAIALSAHLGSFTLIGARLSAAGYPFSVVVKQPADRRFAGLMDGYRARVGIRTIPAKPRRDAVRQILRSLRRNETVLLIADEFKAGKVEVRFLGRPAPAPRGPVTLALRTGAAIVPMFVVRDPDERLRLRILPEVELLRSHDPAQEIAANVGRVSERLEEMIRLYPDQWSWLGFRGNGRDARRRRFAAAPPQRGVIDDPQ
jgi:KDO2-lipid IV(A) lauroyltransferase